jgi:uncharacterized coiled-coil DUF342 family protein
MHISNKIQKLIHSVDSEVSNIQKTLNRISTNDDQLTLIQDYLNNKFFSITQYSERFNSMLKNHQNETEKLNDSIISLSQKLAEVKLKHEMKVEKSAQIICEQILNEAEGSLENI